MALWGYIRLIRFGVVCAQRRIHPELNSLIPPFFSDPSPLEMVRNYCHAQWTLGLICGSNI